MLLKFKIQPFVPVIYLGKVYSLDNDTHKYKYKYTNKNRRELFKNVVGQSDYHGLILIYFAKVPICLVAPAPPALELLVDGVPQSVVGGPFKLFFTIDIVFCILLLGCHP